jgi:hypothetical protein
VDRRVFALLLLDRTLFEWSSFHECALHGDLGFIGWLREVGKATIRWILRVVVLLGRLGVDAGKGGEESRLWWHGGLSVDREGRLLGRGVGGKHWRVRSGDRDKTEFSPGM